MIYKKTMTWTRLPSKLPEDLVAQILSRLPPKSLMRFKCVCESWNSLITRPAFVAMHLSNSKRNSILPTCVLLLERTNYKTPGIRERSHFVYSMRSLRNGPHNPEDNAFEDISIRFPVDNLRGPQFIGHCDWMICLTDWTRSNIFLLNPAINQCKLLPCIPLPHPPDRHGNNHVSLGFGYDPKSDDCKVISISRLVYNEYLDGRCVANPPKVDVYTLGADSWGQLLNIDDYLQTEMTVFSPENLQWCFNGVCYGMATEHPKEYRSVYEVNHSDWIRKVIVSFDLNKEVFRVIHLPDSWEEEPQDPDHQLPGLGVFQLRQWNDESIAMYNFAHDKSLEMWVMDDRGGSAGGSKVAWIKHFTFDPSEEIIRATSRPATFWKNYENLFMFSEDGQCITYNIRTKERELEYCPPQYQNRLHSRQAITFLPSIVSVVSRREHLGLRPTSSN